MPTNTDPVRDPPTPHERSGPREGTGLCLSGGGYRAMLFHVGALWRLNELGWLRRLDRVSSVSGGSITAAQLGLRWARLAWNGDVASNFDAQVTEPIRALARQTLDEKSVLGGILRPGVTIAQLVARAYRKHLYGDATLQDLPDDRDGPRFVINATNVQSRSLVRFCRPYLADWRVGEVPNPTIALADAVAASSAFPPVLSPARIKLPAGAMRPLEGAELHREPYTTNLVLTDGGVYDNLGLEAVWKSYRTVLVSDGGGQLAPEPKPASDWVRHALRINGLIDDQVRSLRKREVVGSLEKGERRGAYWRMRACITDYPAPGLLPCPVERTLALAETPTRLQAMPEQLQERIINWGYALADAALRGWVEPGTHQPPGAFPYPASPV